MLFYLRKLLFLQADNRFRVPKGTRFYRVLLNPFKPSERDVDTTNQTPQMTQSQITTDSAAVQDVQLSCSTASHSVPATPTKLNNPSSSVIVESTSTLQVFLCIFLCIALVSITFLGVANVRKYKCGVRKFTGIGYGAVDGDESF